MYNLNELMSQLPGYIGWKDMHRQYLGCNENLANILQLKEPDKITGLTDYDLLDYCDEAYKFHKNNDELALTGVTIKSFHKSNSPYDGAFYFFIKKPLQDRHQRISGLIFQCHEWFKNNFIHTLYDYDQNNFSEKDAPINYLMDHLDNPFDLSIRELECLFCVLRGMTAKSIGELFNLSKRTIETYIENIKNKFGCRTKSELFIIAITNHYLNIIPSQQLFEKFAGKI
ncbi:MAG: helix-turn-helix transcriptional regulator [Gammaproteobacteria bacterium]|nr:helix-turn-helix transcriptional regulator [Gammaproteobacteria bacterium]